jgi:hypothetical protein
MVCRNDLGQFAKCGRRSGMGEVGRGARRNYDYIVRATFPKGGPMGFHTVMHQCDFTTRNGWKWESYSCNFWFSLDVDTDSMSDYELAQKAARSIRSRWARSFPGMKVAVMEAE